MGVELHVNGGVATLRSNPGRVTPLVLLDPGSRPTVFVAAAMESDGEGQPGGGRLGAARRWPEPRPYSFDAGMCVGIAPPAAGAASFEPKRRFAQAARSSR